MTGFSNRMYNRSPTIVRDEESGKMKRVVPEAKVEEEEKLPDAERDLMERHAKERLELLQKHEQEFLDLAKGANK